MFSDRLIAAVRTRDNPTVVGLDPKFEYLPQSMRAEYIKNYGETLEAAAAAIFDFNKQLIEALYDIIPAVKPQLAYYEMYGAAGVAAYAETVSFARSHGLIVIADGKRNDIGSTAECYADAHIGRTIIGHESLHPFHADALTVNPYLGTDGIRPFIDVCDREDTGIFVLVKTSNKSSGEFQDQTLSDGRRLYEAVAEKVRDWGESTEGTLGYSSVGAVVGATYPSEAARLRKIMPRTIFLVPGYGAQGGSAADAAVCFNPDGGALVNASRSIICAYKNEKWQRFGDDFAAAARAEALEMRDALNAAIKSK